MLEEAVKSQIAALRIQRFMRHWKERNRWMTLRFAVAGAMELRYSSLFGVSMR